MNRLRINFKLKSLDEIVPWGDRHKSLSWYGLTNGELWIQVGDRTVYEYSDVAREFWKCNIRYNDYQLSRFLEDFSKTFSCVCENIPRKFYDVIGELPTIADKWHELHNNDDDEFFDRLFAEEYIPLTKWFFDRVFDSGHLVGGPKIGCFRCGGMIKIWWYSDYLLENGESIWTAASGIYELPYSDFTTEVNCFFNEFYKSMDEQVKKAVEREWREVEVNKARLVEENSERKAGFDQKLALLSEECRKTDWARVDALFKKVKKELSTGE